MSVSSPTRQWRAVTDQVVLLSRDDRFWITVTLLTGLVVHLTYLYTHRYPAYGAGLYLEIADQIAANGYGLPATIPGYTSGGVPFAYPPLWFYIAAVIRDLTGVSVYAYSRLVPGILVTAALVPYYFTAKELLDSPHEAGLATLLFAVTPAVLQWHLSAGGIVRAGAFFVAICGIYCGTRLFGDGDRRWLVPATVLFGLTVLSHPVYTVFFGLSFLLLFAALDRTPRGLAHGAIVAAGGLVLAAPWWLQVAGVHGFGIFTAAAGTHGGLAGGLHRVVEEFVYPPDLDAQLPFFVAAYVGGAVMLWRRRYLLPAWLFAAGYVIGKPRFIFIAGSMLTAALVFRVGLPAAQSWLRRTDLDVERRRTVEIVGVVSLALLVAASGPAFAAGAIDTHNGDPSQPPFIDQSDDEAMAWAAMVTSADSSFVVLGDTAEWFPLRTGHTILVGPWGVEWTTPAQYETQLTRYKEISACQNAECLTSQLTAAGLTPDYIYVPKGHYTIRGMDATQAPGMRDSLIESSRYHLVYENDGAMIFRVDYDANRIRQAGRPAGSPPVYSHRAI
jgi:hypothetical protein